MTLTAAEKEYLKDLVDAGQRMSNAMFNLAQLSEIPERIREAFREMYRAWDTRHQRFNAISSRPPRQRA